AFAGHSRTGIFFQAEDGIRDRNVTGVQTCALPISPAKPSAALSPEIAATNAQLAPGYTAISRYSRLETASASAATTTDRRRPSALTATPPRTAPPMPIHTPYSFDTVAICSLLSPVSL